MGGKSQIRAAPLALVLLSGYAVLIAHQRVTTKAGQKVIYLFMPKSFGVSMPCNKVSYPSVRAALAALNAIRRDPARAECAIHPCAQCHAFHLTSNKSSVKNKWTRMLA